MLTNLAHAYDFNHLLNPSYSGPIIQVAKVTSGTSYTDFQDINAVDGLIDRSAIETFSDGLPVYLWKIYDQVGTAHRTYTSNAANVGVQIYDGATFSEDEFGRIEAMSTGGGGRNWATPDDQTNPSLDVTGSFSLYARVTQFLESASSNDNVLAGLGDSSSFFLFRAQEGSTSGSVTNGFGTPKLWVNDNEQTDPTQGSLYSSVNEPGWKTVAITNGTFPSPTGDQFRFFRGRFITWESLQGTVLIYDADTEADHTDILAFIDSFYDDVQIPRTTITYPDGHPSAGNPIVDADVQWLTEDPFSATDPQWTAPAIVGSNYITNGQGVVEYDPSTDPAVDPDKVYTAIFRKWEWDGTKWEQVSGSATAINNVDLTPPA